MKIELYTDRVLRSVTIIPTPKFKGNNPEANEALRQYIDTAVIYIKTMPHIAELIFISKSYEFYAHIKARHNAHKKTNADSNR